MSLGLDITLGDIITSGAIIGGAFIAWGALRGTVVGLSRELVQFTEHTEAQFDDIKIEMRKIGDVLVQMADFKGEMKVIQERILLQGKRVDDLNTEQNKFRDEVGKLRDEVRRRP